MHGLSDSEDDRLGLIFDGDELLVDHDLVRESFLGQVSPKIHRNVDHYFSTFQYSHPFRRSEGQHIKGNVIKGNVIKGNEG